MYVWEGVYSLLSNVAFVSLNVVSRKQSSTAFLRRNKAIVSVSWGKKKRSGNSQLWGVFGAACSTVVLRW